MVVLLVVALFIAFGVWFRVEPRSIWPGVLLTLDAILGIGVLANGVTRVFWRENPNLSTLIPVAVVSALIGLAPVILGIFLVINAVIMWRKNGYSWLALASGIGGVGTLGYLQFFYFELLHAATNSGSISAIAATSFAFYPLVASFGLAFVSFLTYSAFYAQYYRHFGKCPDAVIVLGSKVYRKDKLPVLLKGRVNKGIELVQRAWSHGNDAAVLVLSGGKGSDEPCAEADAMANYALAIGVPRGRLIIEDKSTTTQENVTFSSQLLDAASSVPPNPEIVIATSDYHAFRGALMMRKAKLSGYALGCPSTLFHWPSAKVREFVAIIVESKYAFALISAAMLLLGTYLAISA